MKKASFRDGVVVLASVETAFEVLSEKAPLIVADPPYGNIVDEAWDAVDDEETFTAWLLSWTRRWKEALLPNAAMYVWGGVGRPGFRPFFRYLATVEAQSGLSLANLITWKKKRAYGVQHNYLFTREELAYLTNGDPKKPRCFNIPLLDKKRGYAGYDPDHPAKSEFLRRSNVWDESEIFKGKVHPCQKADRVCEIPIEVHTKPGELVVDLFSGSGSTSLAARRLGRRFFAVEKDPTEFEKIVGRLKL